MRTYRSTNFCASELAHTKTYSQGNLLEGLFFCGGEIYWQRNLLVEERAVGELNRRGTCRRPGSLVKGGHFSRGTFDRELVGGTSDRELAGTEDLQRGGNFPQAEFYWRGNILNLLMKRNLMVLEMLCIVIQRNH